MTIESLAKNPAQSEDLHLQPQNQENIDYVSRLLEREGGLVLLMLNCT